MFRVLGYTDSGVVVFKKFYDSTKFTPEQLTDMAELYIVEEGINAEAAVNIQVNFYEEKDSKNSQET